MIQIKRPSETLSILRSGRTCILGLVTPGTDSNLGNENWGLGPTAVVLRLEKDNPWVYGMLINNVWSLDTSSTAPKYNNFLLQPFVNCNLPGGHLHQQRADHHGELGGQQRQPVDRAAGGGVGHIFHFGKLPVNGQIRGYYNIIRPDNGPTFQLRVQVQFMFPK